MIKEKENVRSLKRMRHDYDTRLDRIRLGANEYVPSMPKDLYVKLMNSFNIEKASAYPEYNIAYQALAKYLKVSRDNILLSSGADMAIQAVFQTFCTQGDRVLTCAPTFGMYRVYATLANCEFIEVLSDSEGGFSMDELVSYDYCDVRLVILANPNGNTGHCFSMDEISRLLETTALTDTVTVIDEAYVDFGSVDTSTLIRKFRNLVVIRSFSKSIGMAGIRIGYIIAAEELINMIEKFKPMEEINSLAVEAIKVICSNDFYIKDAVNEIISSRKYFTQTMRELGYSVIERHGNFVLVNFKEQRKQMEEVFDRNLIEYKIFSGVLKNFMRLTIAKKSVMDYVINIIRQQREENN